MNAIRIRKKVDSETLHLPELKPMLGREVEIIVLEEAAPIQSPKGDWASILAAAQHLEGYDYEAQAAQDACDIRDAKERFKGSWSIRR